MSSVAEKVMVETQRDEEESLVRIKLSRKEKRKKKQQATLSKSTPIKGSSFFLLEKVAEPRGSLALFFK